MTDPGAALVIQILNDQFRDLKADLAHVKGDLAEVRADVSTLKQSHLSDEDVRLLRNFIGTARWTWKRRLTFAALIPGALIAALHERVASLVGVFR